MNSYWKRRTWAPALLMLVSSALADGGAGVVGASPTVANFRCQGGLQVHVVINPDSGAVRVSYGGQTIRLRQVRDASGVRVENANLLWTTEGDTSIMRDRRTGKVILSGCVRE